MSIATPAIGDNKVMAASSTPPDPSDKPRTALTPEPGEFYYEGPYLVFTEAYHLRRGYCCQSNCRHCPYGFQQSVAKE